MNQRRVPGSQVPPALRMIGASSAGQRTATIPPTILNSTGPMRAGTSTGGLTRRASRRRRRAAGPAALALRQLRLATD
jgi:hypothetical protein